MRFATALLLSILFVAMPAQADIIELHIGQADISEDAFTTAPEQDGKAYRLSAINYVEQNSYLRLELRQDQGEATFPGLVPIKSKRQMLRFGLGERWGTTMLSLGFEVGGALVRVDNASGIYGRVDDEEKGFYGGLDLAGKLGAFGWQVDGTHYFAMPATLGVTADNKVTEPVVDGHETWFGAQIDWTFGDESAVGLRVEDAGEYETATLFLRWRT